MRKLSSGFTLVELLMTLVIVSIITALAVPSLSSMLERQRTQGAANELDAALRFAKSESIKRNTDMVVSFNVGPNWCYGIAPTGIACDCTVPAGNCEKVVRAKNTTTLAANAATLTWQPTGLPTAQNTLTITSNGTSNRVIVNAIGRISVQ